MTADLNHSGQPRRNMKREIIIRKNHQVWEWNIVEGGKVLFGGVTRTKKAAKNDSGIVWRANYGDSTAK